MKGGSDIVHQDLIEDMNSVEYISEQCSLVKGFDINKYTNIVQAYIVKDLTNRRVTYNSVQTFIMGNKEDPRHCICLGVYKMSMNKRTKPVPYGLIEVIPGNVSIIHRGRQLISIQERKLFIVLKSSLKILKMFSFAESYEVSQYTTPEMVSVTDDNDDNEEVMDLNMKTLEQRLKQVKDTLEEYP